MKTLFTSAVIILLLPILATAQWSSDPLENTEVIDIEGTQVVSHVHPTSTGDVFISWYSNTDQKYDVYLQLFDQGGNKLWAPEGVMVSDKPTMSWVTDYDLAVDHNDNAIITNQDTRDGNNNAFAFKVSPDGDLLWGPDGIRLTNSLDFSAAPFVVVTDDNGCVFIYDLDPADTLLISKLGLKKFDADGNQVWGETTIYNDTMDFLLPQIMLTENGNIMASWMGVVNQSDTVIGQERYMHAYVQKFGPDGQSLWPGPVQVDTGNVMLLFSLWTRAWMANDGADGAYVCWQSFEYFEPTVFVNRVGSDGQLLWPGYGTAVVDIPGQNHAEPTICYVPEQDNLFVFWSEYKYDHVHLSDCWAVGGQKFSPQGDRVWGDEGKMIVPFMCAVDSAYLGITVKDSDNEGLGLFYQKEFLYINPPDTMLSAYIYATMVDYDGNSYGQKITSLFH